MHIRYAWHLEPMRSVCSAHAVCVLGLFHTPTHPVYRAVHVFQGSKWNDRCLYCIVSPTASIMFFSSLCAGITVSYVGGLPRSSVFMHMRSTWAFSMTLKVSLCLTVRPMLIKSKFVHANRSLCMQSILSMDFGVYFSAFLVA